MGFFDRFRKARQDTPRATPMLSRPSVPDEIDAHGSPLRVVAADFSPFSGAHPTAFCERERALGFADSSRDVIWLSASDGRRCAAPRDPSPIATAWTGGLLGHEAPRSADVRRWKDGLDPYLLRAQEVGEAVLLDQARGVKEVRSLSWGIGTELRRFRDDVHASVRVETMGARALLLDPTRQRLELLDPRREDVIATALPPPLAA